MTVNHHTAIAASSEITSAAVNDRLSDLDAAITNIESGGTALTGLNVGESTTLTISGGAVTRTVIAHDIDTEAAATTDDLTTINGGAEGDILLITATSASRVVTVKHGTGNISLYSKMDKILDDVRKTITLKYDGSQWCEIAGLATTPTTYPTAAPFRRPATMPVMMSPAARNGWGIKSAAATAQPIGIAAPTITGAAAANQTDSTYISHTSGAVSGNSAGIVTATYNLVRRSHNPKLSMVIQVTDLASVRYWLGFGSAAFSNSDTSASEAAAFRFSSGGGDTGFTPVTRDGATQTTGSSMNTIAAATRYLLEIELTASSAIFTINNGTPVVVTTNLPVTSTELGVNVIVFTTAAAAKVWQFSRLFVEYD